VAQGEVRHRKWSKNPFRGTCLSVITQKPVFAEDREGYRKGVIRKEETKEEIAYNRAGGRKTQAPFRFAYDGEMQQSLRKRKKGTGGQALKKHSASGTKKEKGARSLVQAQTTEGL